jgi:hypothetical protein
MQTDEVTLHQGLACCRGGAAAKMLSRMSAQQGTTDQVVHIMRTHDITLCQWLLVFGNVAVPGWMPEDGTISSNRQLQ